MKKIVTEEIESKTALNRDMYCANCGSHGYEVHHVLDDPDTNLSYWYIECESCGHTGSEALSREMARLFWKCDNDNEIKTGLIWR